MARFAKAENMPGGITGTIARGWQGPGPEKPTRARPVRVKNRQSIEGQSKAGPVRSEAQPGQGQTQQAARTRAGPLMGKRELAQEGPALVSLDRSRLVRVRNSRGQGPVSNCQCQARPESGPDQGRVRPTKFSMAQG